MSTLTAFDKAIDPVFETIGRRKKLIGYKATLNGEQVGILHDCYSDAECVLNAAAYELADDDTVPTTNPDADNIPEGEGPSPLRTPQCSTCGDDGDCPDCCPEVLPPILFCPLCMCVVDHTDLAEWQCRNDRCLATYPDTAQLLTQSELLARRAIVISIAVGICPNCQGEHSIQACPEIRQAVAAPIKRIALGRALCRLRWSDYRMFVTLLSSLPSSQLGMYAESYVAYIQAHTAASDLTAAHVLKVWAGLIDPGKGPAAPALRLAA